jgi:NDP-sugar pyrophosphorylase family protein
MTTTYVLAAGEGRRLRPYSVDRPKCLFPVAGRPLLHHVLSAVAEAGTDRVVLTVLRRHADQVCTALARLDLPLRVVLSLDDRAEGTLGSLLRAARRFPVADEALVWLGDIMGRVDVGALRALKARHGVPAALAVHERTDYGLSGVVRFEGEHVTSLREKPGHMGDGPRPVWAGVALLDAALLERATGTDLAAHLLAHLAEQERMVGRLLAPDETLVAIDAAADASKAEAALRRMAQWAAAAG